ncbi:efflux transporter outer membrane subunit [Novosphingobium album (ex Hu et al. 2023)]|uniref:Efflux transporter outer membrane subunit n=1 Tax=Novosphingobium album (ex Hu et al. 2023) TaxID=2930093 RepID=A0ABT0AXY8_9SPHN|nr:efflux transporter outer membrane subunit [Novosphingobium album (ex Hu et al. 2023)]MCJ2177510.1 efflux transporter outer membrane subunit [Novosphingobium album (ex Hu et al. 2023)]
MRIIIKSMKPALCILPALALGACSLAPKYVAPGQPVPASWPAGDAYLAQSEAGLPLVSYRDIFTDLRLQTLIEQALLNNRDLRVAAANVAAARAQLTVTRANQFPALSVSGTATRSETGGVTSGDGWSYSAQGGISSFELDLFGKLRNATEAQRNTALSTEASARTVRLSLVANLAQAWAAYAADKDLLAIAQSTVANAEDSVRLTTARLKGGIAPRTDLSQSQQVLETARGDVASQTTALAQDVNAIRLLVGADFDPSLLPGGMDEVNKGLAVLPAGTRSEVLLRRPDVVSAEYDLRAANADIGVARAELFPSISLTGLLGFASDALSSLFDHGSFTTTASGTASWSIFNAGGKAANVKVAKAQRDAALATYEKTIQTAFSEVADALADQGTLTERLRAASAYTAAAQDTARLTEATYKQGIASSLDNLDAQRSLYTARKAEVAVHLQAATNRITLYRVLGGDQATARQE